jgi:ABC-type transport system involved in cytochrome c biogenesis permease subunit
LYAAIKARKSVSSSETSGEAAMREAAAEFGVSAGVALGRDAALRQSLGPEEFETQRRVSTTQRKIAWQCLLAVPRLVLTFAVFYAIVLLAHEGTLPADQSFGASATELFETSDVVDLLAVVVSAILLVWLTPHILLALPLMLIVLFRPSWIAAEQGIRFFETKIIVGQARQKTDAMEQPCSEMSKVFHGEKQNFLPQDTSGAAWLKQARNATLDRKLFITITATLVFKVGLIAYLNRVEFNPDIRPIAAVLRSNYWLTVHVFAFIVGYAVALIAWGMALVSLSYAIFGRYRRTEPTFEGQKTRVLLPEACQLFTPAIEFLIRVALVTIIAGTVLGGRWADYSWGRFWSWDPKEVWALITILLITIIFHGKIARYYGAIGTTVGALLVAIAVIITWYGVNFLFTGSVHAYGGGTPGNATIILITFILVNVLWGSLALLVYCAKVYGNESEE